MSGWGVWAYVGGGGIISCGDSFAGGNFGGGELRRPCESQSLHCLTHTLHCQSPQISPGDNFATFLKHEIFPLNYPPPTPYGRLRFKRRTPEVGAPWDCARKRESQTATSTAPVGWGDSRGKIQATPPTPYENNGKSSGNDGNNTSCCSDEGVVLARGGGG